MLVYSGSLPSYHAQCEPRSPQSGDPFTTHPAHDLSTFLRCRVAVAILLTHRAVDSKPVSDKASKKSFSFVPYARIGSLPRAHYLCLRLLFSSSEVFVWVFCLCRNLNANLIKVSGDYFCQFYRELSIIIPFRV